MTSPRSRVPNEGLGNRGVVGGRVRAAPAKTAPVDTAPVEAPPVRAAPVQSALVDGDARVDGRRARTQRTRAAIVDAVIDLVQTGESPMARRIAEHAGIAERTLFAHFADLEQLYAEATREHVRQTLAAHRPIEPSLALGERIDRLAAQRAVVLEAMTPLRRAVAGVEPGSPGLRDSRAAWTELSRRELLALFPERFAGEAGSGGAELLEVAVAVGSLSFWDELRIGLNLDVDGARRVFTRALRQVLVPEE